MIFLYLVQFFLIFLSLFEQLCLWFFLFLHLFFLILILYIKELVFSFLSCSFKCLFEFKYLPSSLFGNFVILITIFFALFKQYQLLRELSNLFAVFQDDLLHSISFLLRFLQVLLLFKQGLVISIPFFINSYFHIFLQFLNDVSIVIPQSVHLLILLINCFL